MARRKVKNGEKSPCGQCFTRPVANGRRRSAFWLVPENFCVFLPNQKAERRRPFATGLVRHCPHGLFSPFFTFLRAIHFRPFRLSLAPTIYPWVSKDGCIQASKKKQRGLSAEQVISIQSPKVTEIGSVDMLIFHIVWVLTNMVTLRLCAFARTYRWRHGVHSFPSFLKNIKRELEVTAYVTCAWK